MYKIPTIEEKIDQRKPSVLQEYQPSGFVRLQPDLYIVQQYPLPLLYGFRLILFDPFLVAPQSYRLLEVKNNTDDSILTSVSSLGSLGTNTYYRKLNALYPLLNETYTSLSLRFVVFTELTGLTTDISVYTEQGCILQEVNITGHIASFSSMVRSFVLDTELLSKIEFPIPAALTFDLEIDLTNQQPFVVHNINTSVGQVDFVLYNNTTYNRARTAVPSSQTFTTRTGGALLWT